MASLAVRTSSTNIWQLVCPKISSTKSPPPCRISFPSSIKCDGGEGLKLVNGRATVPLFNDQSLPKLLYSKPLERSMNGGSTRLKLFSGSANPALAKEIASYMGLELAQINIKRFADGEIYVQLQESVRGCDVFLIQPTCPPANENLMELLIMIDAARRASAKNITAVIPYFGYARADRKTQGRESIAAKLVANLITEAGANRVLACDLHSGQSMGYFDIPVDHVHCQTVILDYLASKSIPSGDLVVVSPDVGGVARARAFAKKLSDAPLAIVDKRRHGHNVAEVMNLIGDVRGKVAVMVDDMIDTAGPRDKIITMHTFVVCKYCRVSWYNCQRRGTVARGRRSRSLCMLHSRCFQPPGDREVIKRRVPGGDSHKHATSCREELLPPVNSSIRSKLIRRDHMASSRRLFCPQHISVTVVGLSVSTHTHRIEYPLEPHLCYFA